MSSDAIAIQTAEAAGRPWVETLHEWVTTVDHKRLGILYILYALVFLIIGGIEATIIRIQLMRPHNDFVSPQVFNRQRHGVSTAQCLRFLAYGSRRISSVFQFCWRKRSLRRWKRPRRGMVRLRSLDLACVFSRSQRGLLDDCVAGLGVRQHLHGDQHHCNHSLYALSRDEAQPDAAAGLVEPGHGRDGYPGRIASYRSSDHAFDRPLPWRALLRYAGRRLCNGFIGLSVWAHHMFTIGMNSYANSFFVFTTMAIAVPTGIKIFNWLGTMWGGKIQFKTPMIFCIGFLLQFLIAGLTGVMMSVAPFDWQLGNSYFVVAHFHYVIVGGILFCLFGAFYYWFPKITGRLLNETLGKLHFWLFAIGFHLTFDSMHIPGLLGMPRRIYTYEPGRGWEIWNLIETIGVFVQGIATLIFVANLVLSYFNGPKAGNDPWDAWTLEWSVSSPPPVYNFASIPTVASRL